MTRTTTVVLDADGTPVVRHEAPAGPAADALRHEAAVLARAADLAVVRVVEAHDDRDGGAVLVTRWVPGGTLDQVVIAHGEEAGVAVLARVAATLADLAERGVTHGRCTADHVVGGPDDVVLCGFSAARVSDDGAAPASEDAHALAALVLSTITSDEEVAREARRAVGRLTGAPEGTSLRAVAADLAAIAATHHAGPAHHDGAAVRRLAPQRRTRARPTLRTGRAPRAAVAAGAVVLGVGALALALTSGGSEAGRGTAVAPDVPATSSTVARPPAAVAPTTTTVAPTGTDPPPPVRIWPDAPIGIPGEVEHEGVRYQVGAAGDLVAVGDWDCDGTPTPTVVRPSDGSIWTFPTWAGASEVLVAETTGNVDAPVAVAVVAEPGGCDVVAVTNADGDEVVVRPG